jgi:hypothetical protein
MSCVVIDRKGAQVSKHGDIVAGLEAMRSAKPGAKLVGDHGVILAHRVLAYANLKGFSRKKTRG